MGNYQLIGRNVGLSKNTVMEIARRGAGTRARARSGASLERIRCHGRKRWHRAGKSVSGMMVPGAKPEHLKRPRRVTVMAVAAPG